MMAPLASPLIENKLFGTHPALVHASGKPEHLPLWPSLLEAATTWKTDARLDPNVTVVTFNNGGPFQHHGKRLGLLEDSLRRSNLTKVTVLGEGATEWRNSCKIQLLLDYLNTGDARQYVLVVDSADVILANHLGTLIETFQTFDCRALFNAERRHWPADLPPFDEQVAQGEYFPCLNSGVWMAETSFARELAAYCAGLSVQKHKKSEQARYKLAYRHFFPAMRLDHRCALFQNINRVGADVVEIRAPLA